MEAKLCQVGYLLRVCVRCLLLFVHTHTHAHAHTHTHTRTHTHTHMHIHTHTHTHTRTHTHTFTHTHTHTTHVHICMLVCLWYNGETRAMCVHRYVELNMLLRMVAATMIVRHSLVALRGLYLSHTTSYLAVQQCGTLLSLV